MLTEVQAGPYTVRGISLGGVYTSLQVPELGVVLDAGLPIRSFAGTDLIFLSHGHADHASGLGSLLGIRTLIGKRSRPRVFMPEELREPMLETLALQGRMHRANMEVDAVGLNPGDTVKLHHDLWVRAFRTHHHVPSLGYQFLRRVAKLKPSSSSCHPRRSAGAAARARPSSTRWTGWSWPTPPTRSRGCWRPRRSCWRAGC
ncbi:MAG TPA: MBL fold metallo-hydrolase [Myxococcaceae bacterium]|nr:MBL fold metallo-hydrolase [Myxococcaceae bacterium]